MSSSLGEGFLSSDDGMCLRYSMAGLTSGWRPTTQMQLGPPLTGSGVSFMAGSFLLPMGQWQTPGGCHKFSRWGHGEPLKSPYWQFSCLGAINEPTAALVQHSAVADRLGGWQDRISTPGSHNSQLLWLCRKPPLIWPWQGLVACAIPAMHSRSCVHSGICICAQVAGCRKLRN